METLKKIGIFFALFLAIVGAGSTLGWLGYLREWVPFIGACIVIGFAFPTWKRLAKKLME